jgi:hypothetical protein
MPKIQVYTNDGRASGLTKVQGTHVFVDDTEIPMVTKLELVADPQGVWTLNISVPVDPATLFKRHPKADEIETTNLSSESRSYVAGGAFEKQSS